MYQPCAVIGFLRRANFSAFRPANSVEAGEGDETLRPAETQAKGASASKGLCDAGKSKAMVESRVGLRPARRNGLVPIF